MSARSWLYRISSAPIYVILLGGAAFAQTIDPGTNINNQVAPENSYYDRGQNVSVRQRARPDYQAEGLNLGGFTLYPKLTSTLAYDSNIYAVQTGVVGDEIFSLAPEIDLQSNWSRNALHAYVRADQDWYFHYADEDALQYGAGLSGTYQFGDAQLTGGLDYGHFVLPRTAATVGLTSEHRIPYDAPDANIQLTDTFNRLRLSGGVEYQTFDYQNGQTAQGQTVFEQGLNHADTTVTGKAEYAVSPDTAVFLTASYNDHLYELQPPVVALSDNSQGYVIAAGANFDITHVMRGEVQLGYMSESYVSAAYLPVSGLSAKGQVEWFPTQLTTVTFSAVRAIADSTIADTGGYVTTDGGLQIDHELLRNLILTGTGSVGEDQYVGIDRTDDHAGAGVAVNWLINRRIGLTFGYSFLSLTSKGTARGPSYDDNRLTVATVLQY